jgi:rRNA small subunit pseudouridine methyltransferase Nep1
MLHMLLLECALELVPSEITSLKEIQRYTALRKKRPQEVLLDQTHHGRSMTRLIEAERRGRPDIVFISLMSMLESPLCKAGLLTVHMHLRDGRIIEVNPEVRLPRNYDRFVGLVEQLLVSGSVPQDGPPLMRVIRKTLPELVTELGQGQTNALSILTTENGSATTIDSLGTLLPTVPSVPVIVGVGAFPYGDFKESTSRLFTNQVKLDNEVMMAWHVCAEILWTYSWRIGVSQKRIVGVTVRDE